MKTSVTELSGFLYNIVLNTICNFSSSETNVICIYPFPTFFRAKMFSFFYESAQIYGPKFFNLSCKLFSLPAYRLVEPSWRTIKPFHSFWPTLKFSDALEFRSLGTDSIQTIGIVFCWRNCDRSRRTKNWLYNNLCMCICTYAIKQQ
jgi:hypothetical protein